MPENTIDLYDVESVAAAVSRFNISLVIFQNIFRGHGG